MAATFVENNSIVIASTTTAGAAAQTAITSSAIDTAGYDEVTFIVPIGTLVSGAVTSLKMQQSDDDAATDAYSDVLGTNITIADTESNKLKYLDVVRPGKRYLKLIITRGTQNATVGGIIAILSKASSRPVTHGSNVAGETHASPAEGTA